MNTEDIEYGYCTEFMVRLEADKLLKNHLMKKNSVKNLSEYGDSLLVISDEEIVKVHIHSEQPGNVLNYGQQYGSLIKMKIENMREQHTAIVGEKTSTPIANSTKQQRKVWNCSGCNGCRN